MSCKHKRTDHLRGPHDGRHRDVVESLVCIDCEQWLSIGPSNDEPRAVQIEMAAARLAGNPESLSQRVRFDIVEHFGWSGQETTDLTVVDRYGKRRIDLAVPLNLDSPQWQAGYLARCIATHGASDE